MRFFAAQSLGKFGHAGAVPALLKALRANNDADAYLRHALVMGLAGCATPAQLAETAKDESRAVRLAAVLALRRLSSAEIAKFLTDADPLIVREAAEAINDAPIPAAYPALAALIEHPVANEAIMLRALNVRFRLGTAADANALADYAARPEAPLVLRQEALALLSLWPQPPQRDRIVGIYRPFAEKTRPALVAAGALTPHLASLLTVATPESVQSAAIQAVIALKISSAAPLLHTALADSAQPVGVRVSALKVLDQLGDPNLGAAVDLALAAPAVELRLAALPLSSRLHPESAVAILSRLLENGTPGEQRAAFKSLGEARNSAADEILLTHLGRLAAGRVAPSAQLELLDAAALRTDPRIKQTLADREAALARDPDPLAPFRVALEGGNVAAGVKLFVSHPVMQCIRCHRAGDNPGGEAGPNLGGIGARASREYILESILRPSAKFAAGFEIVTVTRQNGAAVVGTLVQRDEHGVRVRSGASDVVAIPQADIKGIVSAPSAMPEIAALTLTKAEIRDLVEAAASFRAPPDPNGRGTLRALRPPPTD